jgi:hypothetical protein
MDRSGVKPVERKGIRNLTCVKKNLGGSPYGVDGALFFEWAWSW